MITARHQVSGSARKRKYQFHLVKILLLQVIFTLSFTDLEQLSQKLRYFFYSNHVLKYLSKLVSVKATEIKTNSRVIHQVEPHLA